MKQTTWIKTYVHALAVTLVVLVSPSNAELLLHFAFEQVDFDGVTYTTPDSSGRGSTGTLMSMTDVNLVPGKVGNALQFNGGSDDLANRVELPDDNLDFDRTYDAFTFAAWIKPVDVAPQVSSTTWIAGKMGNSANRGWQMGLTGLVPETNQHQILFGYFDARSGGIEQEVFLGPNANIANDTWVHLAAVFTANDAVKMYVNGDLALTAPGALFALNGINAAEVQFGNRGSNIAESWNGLIDEIRVYDHALTDEEVADLVPDDVDVVGDYNGNGSVDAADFVVWRDTLGSTTDLTADGDGSLMIDTGDYDVWAANFGLSGSGSLAAIPEPATVVLALFAAVLLGYRRIQR
jgi:hypothetical protein